MFMLDYLSLSDQEPVGLIKAFHSPELYIELCLNFKTSHVIYSLL